MTNKFHFRQKFKVIPRNTVRTETKGNILFGKTVSINSTAKERRMNSFNKNAEMSISYRIIDFGNGC